MTSFVSSATRHKSATRRSARPRTACASLLALALPCWLGLACSDDSEPATAVGGSAGSGGTGGGGNAGTSGSAGMGGSSGAAAGAGGSAGTGNLAGSGGAGGSGGTEQDAGPEPDSGGPDGGGAAFVVSSPAFDNNTGCSPDDRPACDLFPDENTGLGQADNVSPEINWTQGPAGTQSYAIALHDLTFSMGGGDPFTHWVMWNIPASATGLAAELPPGANPVAPAPAGSQQVSIAQNLGYTGSGACGNVYEFVLFALSTPTFEPNDDGDPDAVQDDLEASDDVLDTTIMRARSDPNGPSCN